VRADPVLVDTGPLIALFRENEADHERCKLEFGRLGTGLPTSWPVLTEAFFLLRKERGAVLKLAHLLQDGLLVPRELGDDFAAWFAEFVQRFSDREPQLADASLIFLAEREGIETVFTLDSRDFAVYRTSQGKALRIVPNP
jgi:predicted nucleic acid-binding protein